MHVGNRTKDCRLKKEMNKYIHNILYTHYCIDALVIHTNVETGVYLYIDILCLTGG